MSHPDLERFTPALKGRIAYEHLHRYALARDYVTGLDVLDLGCGEGYGTAILGSVARQAVGLDIDADVVRAAEDIYGAKGRIAFRQGDSRQTPFADASFDAVVAFETIEHITEPERLVAEARRILRPGGLFIVSTPNREVYNRFKSPNPFHLKEMDLGEFEEMLRASFPHLDMFGQRMAIVSSAAPIKPDDGAPNWPGYRGYTGTMGEGAGGGIDVAAVHLNDPEYLIAVCSDQPIKRIPEPNSMFLSSADDLWWEHAKIMAWASGLHDEDEQLRAHVADVKASEDDARRRLSEAEGRRAEAEATSARLNGDLQSCLEKLDAQSRSLAEMSAANARLQGEARQGGVEGVKLIGAMTAKLLGVAAPADMVSFASLVAEATGELATLRAAQAGWRRDLDAAVARAGDLEHRLDMEAGAGAHAAAEIERLKSLAQMRDETIAALTRAREAAETEAQASSEKLAAALSENEAHDRERARIEREMHTELQRLKARSTALARELEAARADAATLAQRLASAEAHLEAAERAPSRQDDDLVERNHTLLERLARQEAALDDVRRDYDASRTAAADAEGNARAVTEQAVRLRALANQAMREASLAMQSGQATVRRRDEIVDGAEALHASIARELGGALPFATRQPPPRVTLSRRARLKRWLGRSVQHAELAALIQTGDRHNAARDWAAAEAAYAEALRRDPSLAGIWVQYGHTLKEQERLPLAEIAYRRALMLEPDNADTHLQLGHVLKAMNRRSAARASYARAAEIAPAFQLAREELAHTPSEPSLRSSSASLHSLAQELAAIETTFAASVAAPADIAVATAENWPLPPIADYWLPQRLRDYMIEGYGEEVAPLNWYLFSIVARFGDDPDGFAVSRERAVLAARARLIAASLRVVEPKVSIIVPVYNNLVFTLTSIVSVLETAGEASFEILVGDDGSSDATEAVIGGIGGAVRLVRHPSNLGFLHNCNETARQAKGDIVVFLNNDTIVLPGWLDRLIEPFATNADAGMTGSKLLNGDGSLQEAGGIFWQDGSAWNFGRDQDARLPEFNYLRPVDYCSGASIALSTRLWRQLGGFDPYFAPAYCEDSDLAFRVRQAGFEVYYQPASELVHHEGKSHGRDVSSGIKAYQVANQKKLVERWGDVLARDHFPNGSNLFLARDRSRSRPHILVIDHYVPQWDRDAGSRTMYDYLKLLVASGFQVTFWPDNLHFDREYAPRLQAMGIEVIYSHHYVDRFESWLNANAYGLDVVLFSRPHITARYIEAVRKHPHIYRLYYGHDLHHRRMAEQQAVAPDSVSDTEIAETRALEAAAWRGVDLSMYPSEAEADVVRDEIGNAAAARAIPMAIFNEADIAARRAGLDEAFAARDLTRLLFVGGFRHTPNVDAVLWFVREIMPRLRASGRGFRLSIVGSNAPAEITSLASDDVVFVGRVSDEDLQRIYGQVGMAIVPLRFGGGVKGKVIEAMAAGVPLTITSVGAQGIPNAGNLTVVADDAASFADGILAATASPDALMARAGWALDFIAAAYSASGARVAFGIDALLGRFKRSRDNAGPA